MPNSELLRTVAYCATGLIGAVVLGYATWQVYKRLTDPDDEGFVEEKDVEPGPKKVLVLGLSGAGKTKILSSLPGQSFKSDPRPTNGFDVTTFNVSNNKKVDIWEIGGAPNIRKFWLNFVQDTDILVFVLDASDRSTFVDAYNEMHILLAEPRLQEKLFVVLANKQNIPGAANVNEVKEVLGLEDVKHHRVVIILTAIDDSGHETQHMGLAQLETIIKS